LLKVLCIIVGIVLLICGIAINPLKIAEHNNQKPKRTILGIMDSITSKRPVKNLLDFLSQKGLRTNKFIIKLLELSEAGISLQQVHLLKIMCVISCTILILIISYTNTDYQVRMLVQTSGEKTSALFQDSSDNQSKYRLFKHVIGGIGKDKLSNADNKQLYYLVEREMSKYLNTADNRLIEEKTQWFINTWQEVESVRGFKRHYISYIFLSSFLPDILLVLRWLLRDSVYKKEIIKLEYIFALLARVDGIKAIDIIFEMEKCSRIYSKCLHEFSAIFQYDRTKGFDYLKSRNIKSLSKLTNVLEIYCLSDKEIALQVLDREEMERDESIIITADETIDFIDLIAFLSIVPLIYELSMLMLNPMLDVIYKAFEFI
jgi:hypothetical protein